MTTNDTARATKPVNHRAYGMALAIAFLVMVLIQMGAQQNNESPGPIGQLIFFAIAGRWIWVSVRARNAKSDATYGGDSTAVPSATTRACPWCAEQIQRPALICKHCQRDVETGQLS
jgi:hypothetical protein